MGVVLVCVVVICGVLRLWPRLYAVRVAEFMDAGVALSLVGWFLWVVFVVGVLLDPCLSRRA